MREFTVATDADGPDDFIDAARRHLDHNGGLAIHAGDATYFAHSRAAEAVRALLDAFANGQYFDITVLPDVLRAGKQPRYSTSGRAP